MGVIIPAILPRSREDLEEKLFRLHGIVDAVQVDVVDGRFVSPPCWPYTKDPEGSPHPGDDTFPYLGEIAYDIDLMVQEPEKIIGHWIRAGATRITVHAESTRQLPQIIRDFEQKYGYDKDFTPGLLSFGLAVNIATDLSLIDPFVSKCDYVQFMGIAKIGKQGEPFDKKVLMKVSEFKKKHPETVIQVDGGVSPESIPELLIAGVNRLVVGSDLWKAPDLHEELKKLQSLAKSYGMYA
jgi:ribulose-phosphate 3-epimerase